LNINNLEMRTLICCIAFLISISAFSQSKKELQAQVDQLKKEADVLKSEVQLLKNPKPIELNDNAGKGAKAQAGRSRGDRAGIHAKSNGEKSGAG
jgi:cell division protein FtsB